MMSAEASNILRRFIAVTETLDPTEFRYLRKAAKTLDPRDIRLLAIEYIEVNARRRGPLVAKVIRPGDPVPPRRSTLDGQLRGIARSIIRYGGPVAVLEDADPVLVDAVSRIGWNT